MAEKEFSLKFDGYWRDVNKAGIPKESGIYCVYECTYNPPKEEKKSSVTIHKLIYIGEADDVRDRIVKHEKREKWMEHVRSGNTLCYSFGSFPKTDRDRVEAAMIFHHKPPENTEYKDSFPFDRKTINLEGDIAELSSHFIVPRTE